MMIGFANVTLLDVSLFFFFFQAEDGIRDLTVTGVQTCALPILTLAEFVRSEYKHGIIYPPPKNIFRAFDLCPFDKVEVVILGQDPYHGPRQEIGRASCRERV